MAKFQYSKAISDSFKLIFSNLYVLVPQLLVSLIGFISIPFYLRMFDFGENFDISSMGSFVPSIILVAISSIILTNVSYGWTLALIGKIVKKGKADLFKEFKSGLRKGLVYFLTTLIALSVFFVGALVFMVLFIIIEMVSSFIPILGVLLTILSVIAVIAAIVAFILAFMYLTSVIALENFGAVKSVKLSYIHFKSNKSHSLALLLIIILFSIIVSLVCLVVFYAILFIFAGSVSDEAILAYMIENPVKYSFVSFFSNLPNIAVVVWSFAFVTIAYVRKKKTKK